ncbi:hypothetical protein [Vibrio pectenicida]|uniref:ADP ribosyltransferase domain-containing protein n=1 Tax=Vibrio pectenicida TaxID=62763 RepID=A0A3R9FZ93_9VIBR|nr:hypothetical protein [Vibrio pectenicida]RSD28577.1 hypothetical protein EJA03_18975 [Vibrio pectenicida]
MNNNKLFLSSFLAILLVNSMAAWSGLKDGACALPLLERPLEELLSEGVEYDNATLGPKALERQSLIVNSSEVNLTEEEEKYLNLYSYDSNALANDFLRYGEDKPLPMGLSGEFPDTAPIRVQKITTAVNKLPNTGEVTLYRGGSSSRGTSGISFRNGEIEAGDYLTNRDFLSFTENPGVLKNFAVVKNPILAGEFEEVFDESTVIFKITDPKSARVFAPYSWRNNVGEAESLYTPNQKFHIDYVNDSTTNFGGKLQPFIEVGLSEESTIPAGSNVFDLTSGEIIL